MKLLLVWSSYPSHRLTCENMQSLAQKICRLYLVNYIVLCVESIYKIKDKIRKKERREKQEMSLKKTNGVGLKKEKI